MKKTLLVGLAIILLTISGFSSEGLIKAKVAYFSPQDTDFKDIYGGGPKFGIEGNLDVAKNLFVWLGVDYFAKTGSMTYGQEETKVRIIPVGAGLGYWIHASPSLKFSLGGGFQYNSFHEKNFLGSVTKGKLGLILKGDALFRISDTVGFDAFVNYSACTIKSEDGSFKIGGFEAGAGLTIKF